MVKKKATDTIMKNVFSLFCQSSIFQILKNFLKTFLQRVDMSAFASAVKLPNSQYKLLDYEYITLQLIMSATSCLDYIALI